MNEINYRGELPPLQGRKIHIIIYRYIGFPKSSVPAEPITDEHAQKIANSMGKVTLFQKDHSEGEVVIKGHECPKTFEAIQE